MHIVFSTARLGVSHSIEDRLREVRRTARAGDGLAGERTTFVGDAAMAGSTRVGTISGAH
jgi:hypothetical protein